MIMSLTTVYLFSKNINFITRKDMVYYAAIVCGLYALFFVISVITAYISTNRQMKMDISEAIRNDE
jgi:preprotein translocase subunit SecG